MCDCRKKLIDLTEKHKWCNKTVRYETIILEEKPIKTTLEIISVIQMCEIPKKIDGTSREPPIEFPEIIEYLETKTPCGDQSSSEDECCVELTDISPEELIQQEEDEKRIRDELALIQLTKLTKKRVRTKK
jgi:hypothetical protein